MSGQKYLEDTYCRIRLDEKTAREAEFKFSFIAITGASKDFDSPLSGFLGIGPYSGTSDPEKQKFNFMRQLKE